MDFILENYQSVLVLIAFILTMLFLYRVGKRKEICMILLGLLIKAEEAFGGKTGELKKATVAKWIYDRIPPILSWMFTEKYISDLIDEGVIYMKKYLKELAEKQNIEI